MVSEMRQYRSHMKNRRFQLHQYSGFGSVFAFLWKTAPFAADYIGQFKTHSVSFWNCMLSIDAEC